MPKSHPIELRKINYGHLGTPIYDPKRKRWTFGRSIGGNTQFELLGTPQELLFATSTSHNAGCLREDVDNREERYDKALKAEIQAVIAGNPELQPAEISEDPMLGLLIQPMLRLSEAVTQALVEYDPSKGDLFAVGSIVYARKQGKELVKLLAAPGGECGESLRLCTMLKDSYEWHGGDFVLDSPSEEIGWWTGKGAAIHQICLAEAIGKEEQNNLLAVRLPGCTIIILPQYHPEPVPAAIGNELTKPRPPSRINPNVLFEITSEQTRDALHADVAFNPWNQNEFAIIDQAGQWTIFTITCRPKKAPVYMHKVLQRGRIPSRMTDEEMEELAKEGRVTSEPERPTKAAMVTGSAVKVQAAMEVDSNEQGSGDQEWPQSRSRYDGWARITWVLNDTTILACTRREIVLFNTADGTLFDFPQFLPDGKRSVGWHLDLRRCPNHPNFAFVLTASALSLVEIWETPSQDRNSPRMAGGTILLSTLHFRDQKDISMRMNVAQDENGFLVSIYSCYNPVVTCFQFQLPDTNFGQATASQAIPLILPSLEDGQHLKALGLSLRKAKGSRECGVMSSSSDEPHEQHLYTLEILRRDLAVQQIFLWAKDSTSDTAPTIPIKAPRPVSHNGRATSPDSFINDSPIDEEEDESDDEVSGNDDNHEIIIDPEADSEVGRIRLRTLHYRYAARVIEGVVDTNDELLPERDILDLTSRIQAVVLDRELSETECVETLFEHVDNVMPRVHDLRSASFAIEDAIGSFVQADETAGELGIVIKNYPNAPFLPAPDDVYTQMTLQEVYEHIADHHVTTLSEEFSKGFVERRENIAKSVAAEIMLASSRIEFVEPDPATQVQPIDEDVEMGDVFVESSTRGRSRSQSRGGEDIESSQPLPSIEPQTHPHSSLPTPSSSRATTPSHSRSPYSAPPEVSMKPIIAHLRRNVALTKVPQQWGLKPLILLHHWDLGVDPKEYSYTGTRTHLEEERTFEKMNEKEQKQFLKKRERNEIRKAREARKTERLAQDSSQLPAIQSSQRSQSRMSSIFSQRSSPGFIQTQIEEAGPSQSRSQLAFRPVGSSQALSPMPMVQSSQVPQSLGFGHGRKKKRTKRTEGF